MAFPILTTEKLIVSNLLLIVYLTIAVAFFLRIIVFEMGGISANCRWGVQIEKGGGSNVIFRRCFGGKTGKSRRW
jgi:hypothetical protein